MRFIYSLLLLASLSSCFLSKKIPNTYTRKDEPVKFQSIDLKDLFEGQNLYGQILIYDEHSNQYTSSDFGIAKAKFSPASTFKIPNTIIGLESGLYNESSIFKYDGSKRRLEAWQKDLSFREAFQTSCVPCYQELAYKVGVDQMRTLLDSMKYPGMTFDKSTLDNFWLEGESAISPLEQVDFMRRLFTKQFPLKEGTLNSLKNIMAVDTTQYGILYAKTGMGTSEGKDLGWYVGYIQKPKNRIYFATLIRPITDYDQGVFMAERKTLTFNVLRTLGFW
ncbi:MAG: penicillin-binding transpeptidase domain-containing protein [Crocinitomicaceae bacterium]